MANSYRSEISIGGITLRPTFQALAEIEAASAKSIIELLINFPDKQLTISEIMAIIRSGHKAYNGTILDDKQIELLIQERGLVNILPEIAKFLHGAVGLDGYE